MHSSAKGELEVTLLARGCAGRDTTMKPCARLFNNDSPRCIYRGPTLPLVHHLTNFGLVCRVQQDMLDSRVKPPVLTYVVYLCLDRSHCTAQHRIGDRTGPLWKCGWDGDEMGWMMLLPALERARANPLFIIRYTVHGTRYNYPCRAVQAGEKM